MRTLVTWREHGRVLRAGLVTTKEEREACYRMRYKEYHDVQGEIPSNPEGFDIDWADEFSTLFCTTLDNDPVPVGTMRLIHCAVGGVENGCLLTRGFNSKTAGPTELPAVFSGEQYAVPVVCPRTGLPVLLAETVEGSRYVAHRIPLLDGYTALHSVIFLEASFVFCRENGIRQIIGALRDHHFHSLRKIQFDVAELHQRSDKAHHVYHNMKYRAVFFPVPLVSGKDYSGVRSVPPAPIRERASNG